jgi:hypothetical protein
VQTAGYRQYDIAPDGKHFVLISTAPIADAAPAAKAEIRVVVNWFEELKQKVPAK